ncbi:MAG: universal stress protein [Myxococcales bacterium]|jgi:universal stress protein E
MASKQDRASVQEGRALARRVLVATDFSRPARRAARRAVQLPLARGARLSVLHVLPEKLPGDLQASAKRQARASLEEAVEEAAAAARKIGRDDVRFTPVLGQGRAFVEIIRRARAMNADFIVMGRGKRPSGMRARLFGGVAAGSVAERVVRKAEIPVLVVAQSPSKPYRRVLAAVDLSDISREIADLALSIAPAGATLELLHAYQLPFETSMETYLPEDQLVQYRQELRQAAQQGTSSLVDSLEAPEDVTVIGVVRRGEPRTVVLEEAVRRGADVIVLGTHARSGLAHMLLGSVAESVLRRSPCDALIARPTRVTFELP